MRQSFYAVLFALTLAVRLASPAGWMPVVDGRSVTIALCTGETTLVASAHGEGGGHHQHDAPTHAHQPCPYAVASVPADLAAPAPLATPVLPVVGVLAVTLPEPVRSDGLAAPPPPSRGPPLTA